MFGQSAILILTLLGLFTHFQDNPIQIVDWILFFGLIGLWFALVWIRKSYIFLRNESFEKRQINFLKLCAILIVLAGLIYWAFRLPSHHRNVLIGLSIGFPVAGMFANLVIISLIHRFSSGYLEKKSIIVSGTGKPSNSGNDFSNNKLSLPFNSNGFTRYEERAGIVEEKRFVGNLDTMKKYLEENDVDEILVTVDIKRAKKVRNIRDIADFYGKRVKFIPNFESISSENFRTEQSGGFNVVNPRYYPLDNKKSLYIKEGFDWIFSGVMLLFLSPIFLLIALIIKLESNRPVFYCPIRIGRGGKPFRLYKFCTMNENDPEIGGNNSTVENDSRITKFGNILRKTSLDELPQFINVFLGDMSVVGPRPHRSTLDKQFQESVDHYMLRHYFKPGITGWAQVNGWRGPTESILQKQERTRHDLWYLQNWSIWLDFKIIFKTIFGKNTHKKVF
ncbi:exopolysaccharide biosynthesis polyprenyl glycosylphosphotransferase [Lunatibacter salilacus]|uniref:exopolysaccharide biosynthesis polyprenyl glycosylphosphotransferase n=1 Tax=Lunatibacter salilacus TaxID=2483804 RepID=UPI001F3C86B2|nr:exopolysaccharide biosynthesis polyprenyl glycosylphosphotransferase [Lunatibacter salilacus]